MTRGHGRRSSMSGSDGRGRTHGRGTSRDDRRYRPSTSSSPPRSDDEPSDTPPRDSTPPPPLVNSPPRQEDVDAASVYSSTSEIQPDGRRRIQLIHGTYVFYLFNYWFMLLCL